MSVSAGKPGRPLRAAKTPAEGPAAPTVEQPRDTAQRSESPPCPRLIDDGELTRELDRAERLVRIVRRDRGDQAEPTLLRFDPLPSASAPPMLERHSPPQHTPREEAASPAGISAGQLGAWTLITLGLMGFVCGGVLLGFSLLYERDHFWRVGLPLVLGGQAALIIGLVLQLEGLWHSTQQTSHSLEELDDRLDDLQHATTTLSTTHTPPAATFYAHYAQGASPHLLLADLKGQLDLLAMKLAEQKRK